MQPFRLEGNSKLEVTQEGKKVTSNRLVIPLSGAAARRLALLPCILGFPSNREGPGGLGGPHLAFREAIPRATRHYLIVRLRALTLQPCLGHGTG